MVNNEFPGNVFVSRNYPAPQNVTVIHAVPVEPVVSVTASESVNVSDMIDSATAAEILGVTTNNLRQLVHKGKITPVSTSGRKNLFSRTAVAGLRDERS